MDPARYLDRIGIDDPDAVTVDLPWLRRLQLAHVMTVPFENLAIAGPPNQADWDGSGVSLDLPSLYEKIVERRRGGFCYELNGLFGWLLRELGFETERFAAMVVGADGGVQPPANHLANLVVLDRPYVVDVGLGIPTVRRPIPLDGSVVTDAANVDWRITESDRPDTEYLIQYREVGAGWMDRYYFDTTPRELSYFEASCEFLQSAPESPFTGDPIVTIAIPDGHRKLTRESLTDRFEGNSTSDPVQPDEWVAVLREAFGLEITR